MYLILLTLATNQCTYKEMSTDGWKEPWDADRFNMLDYCLIVKRWRNSISNVKAKPRLAFNSEKH